MRSAKLLVLAALLSIAPHAHAIPKGSLFGLDLQLSAGLGLAGSHGHTAMRLAPETLRFTGEYAISEAPSVSIFGGLYAEGVDRFGLGLQVGARWHPLGWRHGMRLGASLVGMVVPYTLFGVTVEGGHCIKVEAKDRFRPCIDAQAVVFFVGNDLPKSGVAAQLNLLLGVHFNAL